MQPAWRRDSRFFDMIRFHAASLSRNCNDASEPSTKQLAPNSYFPKTMIDLSIHGLTKSRSHWCNPHLQVASIATFAVMLFVSSSMAQLVKTKGLPQGAVKVLGDQRYVFHADESVFVDNKRMLAVNKRFAAIIDVASGKVKKTDGPKIKNAFSIKRKIHNNRWFTVEANFKTGNAQTWLVDAEAPDSVQKISATGHVFDVTSDGKLLLILNRDNGTIELVETESGKVLSSKSTGWPDFDVASAGFTRNESAVGIGYITHDDAGLLSFEFIDFAKSEMKLGKTISKTKAPENEFFDLELVETGNVAIFRGLKGTTVAYDFLAGESRIISQQPVSCLSSDIDTTGTVVVNSGSSGRIDAWNLKTGKQLAAIRTRHRFSGNITFSPDGRKIAICLGGRMRFWDTRSWREIHTLNTQQLSIPAAIALSPNEKEIAVADTGGWVQIWSTSNGKQKQLQHQSIDTDSRHDTWPRSNYLKYSSNGMMLLAGSDQSGNDARLWESKRGSLTAQFPGHRYPVIGIDWSPNGKMIASVCRENILRVIDPNGKLIGSFTNVYGGPVFLADGKHIAASSGDGKDAGIRLYNLQTGSVDGIFDESSNLTPDGEEGSAPRVLALSPDGNVLAAVNADSRFDDVIVKAWTVATGELLFQRKIVRKDKQGRDLNAAISFSQDGKLVAFACGSNEIWIVDAKKGKMKTTFLEHGNVNGLAFGKSNLYSVSGDYRVTVWKIK